MKSMMNGYYMVRNALFFIGEFYKKQIITNNCTLNVEGMYYFNLLTPVASQISNSLIDVSMGDALMYYRTTEKCLPVFKGDGIHWFRFINNTVHGTNIVS